MKNLIEALLDIQKNENNRDWGFINDGGEGCCEAFKKGYAKLVKPYDDWCGDQNYVRLTVEGKKIIEKYEKNTTKVLQ